MQSKSKTTPHKEISSEQHRAIKMLKVILYSIVWLIAWSVLALGMAVALIMVVVYSIAADGVMTARDANNAVLAVILIVGVIFLGVVWLLRKRKSLFIRTSRMVLLVCTIIGLLVGVPASLLGVWQPEYSVDTPAVDTQQTITDDTQGNNTSTSPTGEIPKIISQPTGNTTAPKANAQAEATPQHQTPTCDYNKEEGLKYKYNKSQDEAFKIRSKAIQDIRLQYIGYGNDNPEMLARIATVEEGYQNTLTALEGQYKIWRSEINCTY